MECITRSDKLQDHLRRGVSRNWTIVHHFFFNFGLDKDIRNIFEGFLRSLLYQLIRSSHGVKAGMDTRAVDSLETKPDYRWTLRALQEQLGVVLEQLSNPLCILLDGLDEYQGDKWDMADFLLETATPQVKLCIASRPDMVFEIAFKNTPTIKMQEWNSPAIDKMVTLTIQRSLAKADFYSDDTVVDSPKGFLRRRMESFFGFALQ